MCFAPAARHEAGGTTIVLAKLAQQTENEGEYS
jgi:hypothetical protein